MIKNVCFPGLDHLAHGKINPLNGMVTNISSI